MNREQLSDAIGRLDESVLEEAMTARRRRPWWYAAVAVAACVCLAVGMVTAVSTFSLLTRTGICTRRLPLEMV